MNVAVMVIVVAVGWVAATGYPSLLNLVFGAAVGALAAWLVRERLSRGRLLGRVGHLLSLAALFLGELLLSALRVAWLVLRPDMRAHVKPAFVAFPLTLTSDAEITLLANMITLTPGTLSVDVSEDRTTLYVHAIGVKDRETLVRGIAQGFERRIAEAFR